MTRRPRWPLAMMLLAACSHTEGSCGCCNEGFCDGDVAKSCHSSTCWKPIFDYDITVLLCWQEHISVSQDCAAEGVTKGRPRTCTLSHASNSETPFGICVDVSAQPCSDADECLPDGNRQMCVFTSKGYLTDADLVQVCPSHAPCHP